jgi:hypothetical protein
MRLVRFITEGDVKATLFRFWGSMTWLVNSLIGFMLRPWINSLFEIGIRTYLCSYFD